MPQWFNVSFDLVVVLVMAFAIYFPRYRRKDLLLSYIVLNIGVLAVSVALVSAEVGVGLGFGLFGVLSIIRLRSQELEQQEIAYYFAALALGLVNGVVVDPAWMAPTLSLIILAVLFVVDHPRVSPRTRHQSMTLGEAFTDEPELIAHLEGTLGAKITYLLIKRVDFVNDTTMVEVRYVLPRDTDPGPRVSADGPVT